LAGEGDSEIRAHHAEGPSRSTYGDRAAENDGPMVFARMGVLQAIHRHHVREVGTARKPHHWGKRKLKRDQP
jgi:hypothetical protein